MGKIGFLTVGHVDYPLDLAQSSADHAVEQLTQESLDLAYIREVLTEPWTSSSHARALLREHSLDGLVLFVGTWIEAPVAVAAIQALDHLPLAIWGFPMFEHEGTHESTGSSVGWAVVKAALDRAGVAYKGILGSVTDSETTASAASFCRAASVKSQLARSRIGLVGYASMGMYSATFDHVLLRFRIGPEVEHADSYTIIQRAEGLGADDAGPVVARLKERCRIGPHVREKQLEKAARLYLAMKAWCEERFLDAIAFKCQYEFSQEYGMVGCVPLSLLTEDGIATACEGDMMLAVSMLTLHYLTGQGIYYGDVLDFADRRVYLSSCGFAPYEVAASPDDIEIRDFPHPGFAGICNSFTLKPGRMTWLRFAESAGGHFLTYGTGMAHQTERRQGWAPAVDLELDGPVDTFIENLTSQHYAVCYGDQAAAIKDMAGMLGIPAKRI